MKNFRTRVWPSARAGEPGHAFTVHDPLGRLVCVGWEPNGREWARLAARDAIAEHQAARSAVAA